MDRYMVIDARGKACPLPVIETKKALERIQNGELETIVDNEIARDNVVKMAKSMSMNVTVRQEDENFHIYINKEDVPSLSSALNNGSATVMLFGNDRMGSGDDELGRILIQSLFYTLAEADVKPKVLMFVNRGAFLTCEDSPVLAQLIALEEAGIEILTCGTCLDYYHLKQKLCVGEVTNMYAILANLLEAERAVTL